MSVNGVHQTYEYTNRLTVRKSDLNANTNILEDMANISLETQPKNTYIGRKEQDVRNSDTSYVNSIYVTYKITVQNTTKTNGTKSVASASNNNPTKSTTNTANTNSTKNNSEDELDYTVECPNCHKPVVYGNQIYMLSGKMYCDNEGCRNMLILSDPYLINKWGYLLEE